jgi:hypothetical protein
MTGPIPGAGTDLTAAAATILARPLPSPHPRVALPMVVGDCLGQSEALALGGKEGYSTRWGP